MLKTVLALSTALVTMPLLATADPLSSLVSYPLSYGSGKLTVQQDAPSIAVRSTYADNAIAPAVTRPGTYRAYYQVSAAAAPVTMRVCYLNAAMSGGTETAGPNPLTISASLEALLPTTVAPWLPGASGASLWQFTFKGAASAVVQPSAELCSDDLPVVGLLNSNTSFYVRTHAIPTTGGTIPSSQGLNSSLDEVTNRGDFSDIFASPTVSGQTISGTLTSGSVTNLTLPLVPGTIHFVGAMSVSDDGNGNLVGSGWTSGTINYTTGAFSGTSTGAAPSGALGVIGIGKASTTPADDTMTAAATPFTTPSYLGAYTSYQPTFGPTAILGQIASTAAQNTDCIVGDSILSAVGNSEPKAWPEYAGQQHVGFIRIGQPSEAASQFALPATSLRRFRSLLRRCTRVYGDYGTNDIASGATASQIEANLTTIWANLAAILPHGYKDITWQPISPRTASASSQTPLNSGYGPATVANGSPSTRNAVNAWECAQVGVLIGALVDVNSVLEGNPSTCAGAGDGTWKSLSLTADGTHFSPTATQTTLPGVFGYGGTAPAAVFQP